MDKDELGFIYIVPPSADKEDVSDPDPHSDLETGDDELDKFCEENQIHVTEVIGNVTDESLQAFCSKPRNEDVGPEVQASTSKRIGPKCSKSVVETTKMRGTSIGSNEETISDKGALTPTLSSQINKNIGQQVTNRPKIVAKKSTGNFGQRFARPAIVGVKTYERIQQPKKSAEALQSVEEALQSVEEAKQTVPIKNLEPGPKKVAEPLKSMEAAKKITPIKKKEPVKEVKPKVVESPTSGIVCAEQLPKCFVKLEYLSEKILQSIKPAEQQNNTVLFDHSKRSKSVSKLPSPKHIPGLKPKGTTQVLKLTKVPPPKHPVLLKYIDASGNIFDPRTSSKVGIITNFITPKVGGLNIHKSLLKSNVTSLLSNLVQKTQQPKQASTSLQQQKRASTSLQQQKRASTSFEQQKQASTSLQQQKRASTSFQQQKRASTSLQQQKRASTSPQQKRASTLLQQQKRASTLLQQQKRASTLLQQQKRASTSPQRQKRASTSLQQQKRASTSLQQQKGASTSPQQQKEASTSFQQTQASTSFQRTPQKRASTSFEQTQASTSFEEPPQKRMRHNEVEPAAQTSNNDNKVAQELEMLCRICALPSREPLFKIYSTSGLILHLADKMNHCLPLTVQENDGLPQNLCVGCRITLDQMYSFYNTAEASDKLLKKLFGLEEETTEEQQPMEINSLPPPPRTSFIPPSNGTIVTKKELDTDEITIEEEEWNPTDKELNSNDEEQDLNDEEMRSNIDELNSNDEEQNLNDEEHNSNNEEWNADNDNQQSPFSIVDFDDDISNIDIYEPEASGSHKLIPPSDSEYMLEPLNDDPCKSETPNELPFNCHYCRVTMTNAQSAALHYRKYHYKYLCQLCCCVFNEATKMKQHINSVHRLSCEKCSVSFRGGNLKIKLQKHMQRYHSEKKTKSKQQTKEVTKVKLTPACTICDTVFNDFIELKEHHLEIHQSFLCHVCVSSFETPNELMIHIQQRDHYTQCVRCDMECVTKKLLVRHLSSHAPEQTERVCTLCNIEFDTFTHLGRHYLRYHKVYLCDNCLELCPTYEQLNEHCLKEHGIKSNWNYSCYACSKLFANSYYLRMHIQTIHNVSAKKKLLCSYCGKEFKHQKIFTNHIRRHEGTDSKKYECEKCNMLFRCKRLLNVHVKRHLGIKDVNCDKCPKSYYTQEGLSSHIIHAHTEARNYPCTLCDLRFKTPGNLRNHKKRRHLDDWKYTCNYCETSYKTEDECLRHSIETHPNIEFSAVKTSDHLCKVCKKYLQNRLKLREHVIEKHGLYLTDLETGNLKDLTCKTCQHTFNNMDDLIVHLQETMHNRRVRNKPNGDFECPECNKKYTNYSTFMVHKAQHKKDAANGDGEYKCDQCPKSFHSETSLHLHSRVHEKDDPQECGVCNKLFINKSGLKSHMKTHAEQYQIVIIQS